jgi:DNA polymerase
LVPQLSARERRVWELDARINARGIKVDFELVRRAAAVVEYAKTQLDAEMRRVTAGAVRKCTEAKKLAEWITSRGIPCESVAKGEQEDLAIAAREIDDAAVLEALRLRREASKSSTAKLLAMELTVCRDGRIRGLLADHGAHTGRWAGRLVQPQNLHRADPEEDGRDIEITAQILRTVMRPEDAYRTLDLIHGSPMVAIAKSLRSMFVAAEGYRYVGGDLSNIEGCVSVWLAGEDWKVQAYRDNQAGTGPDLYRVAYSRAFGGAAAEATGKKRQVGKVMELAFGFQGAIGSFISMGANYGMKPAMVVDVVRAATDNETWAKARALYSKPGTNRYGLPPDEWTALRITVDRWREAHPAVVSSWWEIQDAAVEAVASPGRVVRCINDRIAYMCNGGFLWCLLPSGRTLAYLRPELRTERSAAYREDGSSYERVKRVVSYEGFDGEKKRWDRFDLYGGMQWENVVQAIARDVLVDGMFEAEEAGYSIVLTVHDELLTEVPQGWGSVAELKAILSRSRKWYEGLPLAAKCWEDVAYVK